MEKREKKRVARKSAVGTDVPQAPQAARATSAAIALAFLRNGGILDWTEAFRQRPDSRGSCKYKQTMALNNAPDLTQRPPRSPRVRLGGYVILPRMLDKGRAAIVGKQWEYNYDCPMDQKFLGFAGVSAQALKKQLAAGKGDGEILQWIEKNAKHQRSGSEIAAWSAHCEQIAPADTDSREFFQGAHAKLAPKREDIATWFDLLDLDDYVSFGGNA